MVEEHRVAADELRQVRDRLDAYEQQYGRPSSRMLDVPEFRDDAGNLIETADLMAWSSLWDKYSLLTLPHVDADLNWEADDGLNQAAPTSQEPRGQHQPEDEPANCLEATLHELAGAVISGEERQATLEHGLRALRALTDQLDRRSRIFHVDLSRQHGPRFWVAGPQAEDLRVGEALYVSDTGEEPGNVAVLECRVSSIGEGGAWVEEQPPPTRGISDYRVLHTIEPQGVRTHLILVVDDRASVVRLTIVLDRGQTSSEMDALLTEVSDEWLRKLRALTPAQQRQFAAAVDETTDAYMLLEDVRRPEPPSGTSQPPKGRPGSQF